MSRQSIATKLVRQRVACTSLVVAGALLLMPAAARSAEVYGGIGTTGAELGVTQGLGGPWAGRAEINALSYKGRFSTNGIAYDTKLEAVNAGLYLDAFVSGGLRVTGGALLGSRKYHGTATSLANTVTLNGVTYPVSAGDSLDFEARFPRVAPYLGIGYGHRSSGGLQVYADAGVAYGRPKVSLSPSASLAVRVNPADLAAEQSSVQSKADRYRAYPVLKVGVGYAF